MRTHPISKIVSGGQTGVDRAALDVAIFLEIEHGGWCPLGRRSEDGRIPEVYRLRETTVRDYSVRTEKNVVDSDGTLILFQQKLSGGTKLTYSLAVKHNRPFLCFDLNEIGEANGHSSDSLLRWIKKENIDTLNVAGPRESTSPGISKLAEAFMINTFEQGR